jgi:hypothetical protein
VNCSNSASTYAPSVGKYLVRSRRQPSQTWLTFLENHAKTIVSIDFFTVPTIRFQVLYVPGSSSRPAPHCLFQCHCPSHGRVDRAVNCERPSPLTRLAVPASRPRRHLRRGISDRRVGCSRLRVRRGNEPMWTDDWRVRRKCLDHVMAFGEDPCTSTSSRSWRIVISRIQDSPLTRD